MRKLANDELNRLTINEFKKAEKIPCIVVLDNVRSQNNVGSVFRTSDAFLVNEIFLCGITATPPQREIHKTALGATESVDWRYFSTTVEAVKFLKENGYHIVSIEQAEESADLMEFDINKNNKYAIVFGNEVNGVDQEIVSASDSVIELSQYGTKHSLNISVCAGIVIWEFFKNLK